MPEAGPCETEWFTPTPAALWPRRGPQAGPNTLPSAAPILLACEHAFAK